MVFFKYDSFINDFLVAVPELKPIYQEHIAFHNELLAHVFFGDVTRFSIKLFKKKKIKILIRLLNFLNQAMESKDEGIQELISLSFLENLPQSDQCYNHFKKLLGNALRNELKYYE